MTPRDVRVVDDDVAVVVAPEDERVAIDENRASTVEPAPDGQPHAHSHRQARPLD